MKIRKVHLRRGRTNHTLCGKPVQVLKLQGLPIALCKRCFRNTSATDAATHVQNICNSLGILTVA